MGEVSADGRDVLREVLAKRIKSEMFVARDYLMSLANIQTYKHVLRSSY